MNPLDVETTRISSYAQSCLERYKELINQLSRLDSSDRRISSEDSTNFSDKGAYIAAKEKQEIVFQKAPVDSLVKDQLGRFHLWMLNIGIFAPLKLSLDYRLRDAPDVKDLVLRLLDSHRGNVERLKELLGTENTKDIQENVTGDDRPETLERRPIELGVRQAVRKVALDLDRLHRLSNSIRSAGSGSRNLRAVDYRWEDSDGNDLGAPWKTYRALRLIDDKYPKLSEIIRERLSSAMLLRRKRILYQQSRHQKLAQAAPPEKPASGAKSEIKRRLIPPSQNQTVQKPKQLREVMEDGPPKSLVTMNMTASSFDRRAFQSVTAPSKMTPMSLSSRDEITSLFPPKPRPALVGSSDVYQCPYCGFLLSLREIGTIDLWRKHCLKDIAPYICLFELCSQSEKLFDDEKDWLSHMRFEHKTRWRCTARVHSKPSSKAAPVIFDTKEECANHFRESHPGSFTQSQLPILVESCASPVGPTFEVCPMPEPTYTCSLEYLQNLAPNNKFSLSPLEEHVRNHLIFLALKSLPEETQSKDGGSTGTCSTRKRDSSELWSEEAFGDSPNDPSAMKLTKALVLKIPEDPDYVKRCIKEIQTPTQWSPSDQVLVELQVTAKSSDLSQPSQEIWYNFSASAHDAFKQILRELNRLRRELNGDNLLSGSITLTGARRLPDSWEMKNPAVLRDTLDLRDKDEYKDTGVRISLIFAKSTVRYAKQEAAKTLLNGTKKDIMGQDFISGEVIREALTTEIITRMLSDDHAFRKDLDVDEIHRTGIKLLATLIVANTSSLGEAFMHCWRNQMGNRKFMRDDSMPFAEEDMPMQMKEEDQNRFLSAQWMTCAVEFNAQENLPKAIGRYQRIPIISKIGLDEGHYGQVSEIKIVASHQKLYQCLDQEGQLIKNPSLALKEFTKPFWQQMKAFSNETEMLLELNKLDHKHLIRLLFAFTYGESSALILPLAKCNLNYYFENTDPKKWDTMKRDRQAIWFFEQFRGLAHGLAQVHENTKTRMKDHRSLGQTIVGYHHDLKPSNILLFRTYDADREHPFERLEKEFGRLQISDFGLGKFRTMDEGTGTQTILGTVTYRPPECDPNFKPPEGPQKQNRKYDIWCIGCILVEVLVWIFHGRDGHEEFESMRSGPVNTGDDGIFTRGFYHKHADNTMELRPAVTDKLDGIKSEASGSKIETPVLQTIELISMCLQIEPEKRPTAQEVATKFEEIALSAQAVVD